MYVTIFLATLQKMDNEEDRTKSELRTYINKYWMELIRAEKWLKQNKFDQESKKAL